jgi:hypothetical protein
MKFIGGIVNILKKMLQKTSFKKSFLWKSQNVKKKPICGWVLIDVGSFDYDCTQICPFFISMFFVLPSKPLECNLIFFMKKQLSLLM